MFEGKYFSLTSISCINVYTEYTCIHVYVSVLTGSQCQMYFLLQVIVKKHEKPILEALSCLPGKLDSGAGDTYDLIHSSSVMAVSLPLEVASEKNSKHAWEMGVVTLKKRGRESL